MLMKKEDEEKEQKTVEKQGEPVETVEAPEETEEKLEELLEEEEEEKEGEKPKEETAAAEEESPTPVEEEAKPKPEEKKEEEEIVEERIYTIPLSKAWIVPANRRSPKAMRILKQFITRHMKMEAREEGEGEEEEEPSRLIISNEVNEKLWSRGIEKPPRNIRVRAAKDKEGNVTVYLAEGD
jgi:large subunit ribosomal protein L31e